MQWLDNRKPEASFPDWIPVLAWFSPLNLRRAPVVEDIHQQPLRRPAPDPTVWGGDPLRLQMAQYLCRRIQEQYAYPNDHFLPQDSVEILFQMP